MDPSLNSAVAFISASLAPAVLFTGVGLTWEALLSFQIVNLEVRKWS